MPVTYTSPRRLSSCATTLAALLISCVSLGALGCSSQPDREPGDDGDAPGDAGGEPADPGVTIQEGACEHEGDEPPDFLQRIGCRADFEALASVPLDTSIPGARSVKVVLDQADGDALYFQNSVKYPVHWDFASEHLSGGELPYVDSFNEFTVTEYYVPDRRFVLGAVTFYEGAEAFTLELSPYDTASPDMVNRLFAALRDATYFGPALKYHPTSSTLEDQLPALDGTVVPISTDELYQDIDYQPLNLATGVGRLRFVKADELASLYLSFSDLVVLDAVPNDISVVAGMITEEFQTPLAHVNVLAQNRKTPNMGLRGAFENETLRALDGKWVKLTVGAFEWTAIEVTTEEATEFIASHGPAPVELPPVDLSVTDLRDIEELVVLDEDVELRDAIVAALPAWGGKAAHYSVMAQDERIPMPKAFGVPTGYYVEFMQDNGFYAMLEEWLADPDFIDDPMVRDARLSELRAAMMDAPVDEALQELLRTKLEELPEERIRFRTSTNSEDLEGFPCAGCYESHTGVKTDWEDVLDAIRETWASIWLFRTFEERSYYKVDHRDVTMALLVHHSFPTEEANGVALTANPFDPKMMEPGFYINVQFGGDFEVVHPPAGVTSDEIIYAYQTTGQPAQYLTHSNVLPPGQETVLDATQLHSLGEALDVIHRIFSPAYGPGAGNQGWYAMDVEFKFDGDTPETATLHVKQARPHPGRGK
jgi:pyruvate,water dikinase